MASSRITTGVGDGGRTRALDSSELPKNHPTIEALGALDELRARTALLRLIVKDLGRSEVALFLEKLLHMYFPVGTAFSDPLKQKPEYWQAEIEEKHVALIESEQSNLEESIDWPKAFVAGAATEGGAQADLAATAARDLERRLADVREAIPQFEGAVIAKFVNRLSDYFFVLARHLDDGEYLAVDYDKL